MVDDQKSVNEYGSDSISSWHPGIDAVSGSRGRRVDGAASRNALADRQRRVVFDMIHQYIEGALSLRLDVLDHAREQILEAVDVCAVLDFVQSIL